MQHYNSMSEFFEDKSKNNLSLVHDTDGTHHHSQTFHELYLKSLKIAYFLKAQGIQKGDVVALMSKASSDWLATYMGIVFAGACVLAMDRHLTAFEVKNIFRNSNPKYFFIEREVYKKIWDLELDSLIKKFIILESDINYLKKTLPLKILLEQEISSYFKPVVCKPEDPICLIYTSGTTSNPKGVLLKHKNFLSQRRIATLTPLKREDTFLTILPYNHVYGFTLSFVLPLEVQGNICILSSLKSPDILNAFRKYKVSVFTLVPAILEPMYKAIMQQMQFAPNGNQLMFHLLKRIRYLSKDGLNAIRLKRKIFKKIHAFFGGHPIKCFISGSAGLDEEISKTFNTFGFPIYEGYGLTETSPTVIMAAPGRNEPGTVGKVLPGVEMKLLSPDAEGVGEVVVKGDPVFEGYFKSPELNKDVFTEDGFFRTGDLGRYTKNGMLSICGRIKDMIVLASGKKVFPEEVEDFYRQCPAIKEIAVLGIPKEIGKKAEEIYAVIFPNQDFFKSHGISEVEDFIKNAISELSEKLPSWRRLNRLEIRYDALPKTSTNKVKKHILKQEIVEQLQNNEKRETSLSSSELFNSPLGLLLKGTIEKIQGREVVLTQKTHLFLDLGFDSLSLSELIVTLESKLNKELPKELIQEMKTMGEALNLLTQFCEQNSIDIASISTEEIKSKNNSQKKTWAEILSQSIHPQMQESIQRSIESRRGFGLKIREFLISFLGFIARLLFHHKTIGAQNIPQNGAMILASDHYSFLDALFILTSLPKENRKRFFCIGAKEHLEYVWRAFFVWLTGMIPVDREGNFIPSLQASKQVLDSGNILLIFPEGTRSRDGFLNSFKQGVGILSEVTNAPVVPIHLQGTYEALSPDKKTIHLNPIRVHFDQVIDPNKITATHTQTKYEIITEITKEKIIKMGAKPHYDSLHSSLKIKTV
ncbi:MAG: AMP-binding protein [Deltaproteobacteria bacterium]|nr:AMP-binding protein [Deltaproteobacteria bacterium]